MNQIQSKKFSFKWVGHQGLMKASNICREFYIQNAKIPTTTDLRGIYQAIRRGNWEKYDVNTWSDFLKYCDLPVTIAKHSVKIHWQHENALEFAILRANYFHKINGRSPRTKDMEDIYAAIYSGYWQKQRISTWNDFLKYANLPINRGSKWYGLSGLKHAISQLIEFQRKNDRNPTITDFKSIFSQINRGVWKEFGIENWNHMINHMHQNLGNSFKEKITLTKTNSFLVAFEFSQ